MHQLCYCVHWLLQVVTWWETSDQHSWDSSLGARPSQDSSWGTPTQDGGESSMYSARDACENNLQPKVYITTTCLCACIISGNSTSFSFTEPPPTSELQPPSQNLPLQVNYNLTLQNHPLQPLQAFFWSHKVPKQAECMTNCTVTAETKSRRFMRLALVD